MMNVLMITPRFIYGGIEKLLIDFFTYANKEKFQYSVLIYKNIYDKELKWQMEKMNIPLYSLNTDRYENKWIRWLYEKIKLYQFLKKQNFQIIHIHNTDFKRIIDLWIAKIAGVKRRVMHSHNNLNKKHFILPLLFKYVATDLCACSYDAAVYLYGKRNVDKNRCYIINNGISMKDFQFNPHVRKSIRKNLEIKDDELVIGHIGRFSPQKNHMLLINIFAEIVRKNNSVRLLLVGEGELKEQVKAEVKKLGLEEKVILFGSTNCVGEILSTMDIFVMPSLWEGLGTVLIEAQCNGLPCCVSNVIPKEAILANNIKILKNTESAGKWAEEILAIERKRSDNYEALKNKGFDIENTVKQLECIYSKGASIL